MDKFLRFLFSMKMMSLGLVIFLFAIGTATILESMYNIQTAKIIIYNAAWFEILLVFLGLSLIANIFRYKMWAREKIAMLMFHLSFIVILIGAGITRYISFEGIMQLPEPDPQTGILRPVEHIYSADPRLKIFIDNKYIETTMYLSEQTNNYFDVDFEFPEKKKNIKVEYVDFQSKHIDSLIVNDTIQNFVLDIVTGGRKSNYLSKGEFVMVGDIPISFDKKDKMPGGIEIYKIDGRLMMKTGVPMRFLPMSQMQKIRQSGADVPDSMFTNIPVDTLIPFQTTTLYYVNNESFVFKEQINHAKMMRVPSGRKDAGNDYLTLKITDGKDSRIVVLEGGMGVIATEERFNFNGLLYSFQYGAIPIKLPFAVACNDFTLDRYPGSNSPSSFESVVTVIDPKKEKNHTQRIFMNNVMDYDGYRFFQSNYFPDETGTILSVNHDYWGTTITYIGYLMMAIGMIMSLFAPIGRFRELIRKIAKVNSKGMMTMLFVMLSIGLVAQEIENHDGHDHTGHDHSEHNHDNHDHSHSAQIDTIDHATHNHGGDNHEAPAEKVESPIPFGFISEAHSDKLAYLLVQDFDGRIVPLHTVCDELLRKIHRGNKYEHNGTKYNAVQTVMSIHMNPISWLDKKIIYVSAVLRDTLGLKDAYASYNDLLTENGEFKLFKEYEKAHQKLDKNKGEFDKQLIKLNERLEIFSGFQLWFYMKMIPVESDGNNGWYNPMSQEVLQNEEALFKLTMEYFSAVFDGLKDGNYAPADAKLKTLLSAQRKAAGNLAPSESKVQMEISYNKMNIFKNAQYSYLLLGFVLLGIFLFRVLLNMNRADSRAIKITKKVFVWLMFVIFLYHGAGLAMRWYISGHAPWSNGYEAVVFIAWVTMLAGFILSRIHPVVLAAASILAFCMLFVTEMNILDPEITPLVPVLKSYWLMIHVAIITGSYGFLGMGAILGLINLLLYATRNYRNKAYITDNISILTYVSEMAITIGLFMLTIGTFLGGVWANESWGRYWGWDPKETWALVSVLVYAVILHFRFIPALKDKFAFNVASLWGFTAILFTFFGVNFYLVGLHSYAQGDGLGEFPMFVIVIVVIFYMFTEFAAMKSRSFSKKENALGLSYFMRKSIILSASLICAYLLFILLHVITFTEFATVSLYTIGIVFVTNLSMFGISKVIKPVSAISEAENF